jgi:hypothetical protein
MQALRVCQPDGAPHTFPCTQQVLSSESDTTTLVYRQAKAVDTLECYFRVHFHKLVDAAWPRSVW